ncbi:MAG: hypothetical protein ABIC57_03055 [bacterium]
MKKEWKLTEKVLCEEKTVETRWYKHRSAPWNLINPGDIVYFKDSGKPVSVSAKVSFVEQYDNLDNKKISEILNKYSKKDLETSSISKEISNYIKGKKYCIIVGLEEPKRVKPFNIDKTGFGTMSAWITLKNINLIKKK